ncbi:MAG: DUF1223 domain-containing protein [Myxococcota bacterium]
MWMMILSGVLAAAQAGEPVAVLELFTSEGCSSCPPAERLFAEVAEEARRLKQPILSLSFHVDYWDRLGWPDPYADASNTERQRAYARALHSESIYTPQLVINGQQHMVGSDRAGVSRAIRQALAAPAALGVAVGTPSVSNHTLRSTVRLTGSLEEGIVLTAAVTEAEARTAVEAGENRGRVLTHVHVVRAHQLKAVTGDTVDIAVRMPEDFAWREAGRLVVLAQRQADLHVLGAVSAPLGSPSR